VDFTLEWGGEPEDLLVTMSGKAVVDDVEALEEAVADSRWHRGMRVLLDQRLVDWSGMTAADVEQRAEAIARKLEPLGEYRTAVVLADSLGFGLVRMEQALIAGGVPGKIGVFRSLKDARAWLREPAAD
jgi:hypothetical protein